jgi:hypothetical protein
VKKIIYIFAIIILSACTINSNVIKEPYSEIELYFCPEDFCLERILTLVDESVDIKCAFYDLDIPILIEKLQEKNADVIIEDDNALESFHTGYSSALMHNKFCIFDNNKILTGSMNPTERGNYYNNNNIIIIKSNTLAKNYLNEFTELKKGIYGKGEKNKEKIIYFGDTIIENYFCPEDECKYHVIKILQDAKESIYFMTFSFTDEDIGNLIWNKDYLGLDVKGILEKKQIATYSRYEDLKEFSIIDNNKYTMHHKVFIIDEEIVITGSYNPTKNANERNDENILIIHDKKIANKFIKEFEKIYENKNLNFPKSTTDVIISKILYDVKGSDKGNEYVEIKNKGNNPILLDYYFLSDNKTNERLKGILEPNEKIPIKPKFSLKNKEGFLILKKHQEIIDYVYWEGIWNIEAKEDDELIRIDNNKINDNSWSTNKLII